ncbi:MAG TPA: AAA family ATPase [Ramlibacter sp.]|nr:AAA family ATPase [Ramlibacter sp.]
MTVNPAGNRFCEDCGKQLQLTCAKCGHDVNLGARFCGNCGSTVQSAASGSVDAPPKWGELKQATVFFADIVGSTDLVAHMDPEQAMARLRPAVLRMRHSIERFGGTVLRTLGDGVMAMFGVPRSLEGHALLACQAALHMQAAFNHGEDGLRIRIGLHSGQVASDPEDAEDGRGGGAHGLTIHLASRVIALAQPGGICLTLACRNEAGAGCVAESIGMHRLKGIPDPVEIFALQGVEASARRNSSAHLVQSTFRGRDRELAVLESFFEGVGRPEAINVVGIASEPGGGKSRLCDEFSRSCAARGVPVYDVRAQLYGHSLPLQPILELFRTHFFGISATDDAAVARARIAAVFAPMNPEAHDLDLLYEFFRVSADDAPALALGPRARQARVSALLKQLVRLDAQARRVILIEDLHWIDEASEEFVSALAEAVTGTHTLVLLNYRPAYRAPWLRLPHFRQVELGELPQADMDALVAELLSHVTSLPEICRLVCLRSGGNPFFAEELVRTIAESGVISHDGLPVGGLEAVERVLPATLQAVIGARLDRLGEPEKTLLQMCAIIGKEIPLAVLEHVASPLAAQIEHGLDGLCQAGLILPQPAQGGRSFAFRHPLIQEVAYTTQLKVRRGQVHASVAVAMELYYGEDVDEYAALIGYHFEQAGTVVEASKYYERAANWVGSLHAAQAIRHWHKVRDLLDKVRGSEAVDRQRATAGAKVAILGWREGMTLEQVKPLIDEALLFANQGDDRLVPWLLTIEGRMMVGSGGPADGYVERVKKALLYIDVDRDPGRVAVAQASLCQAYSWAGLLREALQSNDVARESTHHVQAFERAFFGFSIEQWVMSLRARILIRMGRAAEAREVLDRLLDLEAASREPPVPGMSRIGFVDLAWLLRDADMARDHAHELPKVAQKYGTPYLHAFSMGSTGTAASIAGDHERAANDFSGALKLVRETGAAREYEPELLASLAETQLHLEEWEAAHAYAGEAIALSRARTTRVAECRGLIARGHAAAALGRDPKLDFAQAEALIGVTGAFVCRATLERARALSAARAA